MGGAVAVHVAAERLLSSLVGIVVIDVVEGIKAYPKSLLFLNLRSLHQITCSMANNLTEVCYV